jgi:hypothetical protein
MTDINPGQAIGNQLKNIGNVSGLSAIDSSIENFTKKDSYSKLLGDISLPGSKLLNINGTSIGITDKSSTGLYNSVASGVSNLDKQINISQYLAPTTLALKSIDKMGEEIDKSIKSAFLLQAFNIKATDILCTVFCFLLSTLSCSTRNELYNAIQQINNASQAIKSGVTAVNQTITAIGGVAASLDNISASANNLFSGNGTAKDTSSILSSAATMLAAPAFILDKIKIITNALKLGLNFKFMMPDIEGKSLWDFARHVLFMMESIAMQAADEGLSKLIKPIEDMITSITPSICFGTMAVKLQQMLISTIKTFKSRLLEMLTKLMVGDADFNLKFQQFNLQSAFGLEIQAFVNTLEYIAAHFFDIAVACGISPCGPNSIPQADQFKPSDIGNLDTLYNTSTTIPSIISGDIPIISNNIEDIANKIVLNNKGLTYVTPDHIISVYDLGDTPKKIVDLIKGGALNDLLDSNYSIYNNNNQIKIVNTVKRNCGDNN